MQYRSTLVTIRTIFLLSLLYIVLTCLNFFHILNLPLSVCLFHNITHMPCPTCGITRGVLSTLSGHFLYGFEYHILAPFLTIGLLVSLFAIVYGWHKKSYFRVLLIVFRTLSFMNKYPIIIYILSALLLLHWSYKLFHIFL